MTNPYASILDDIDDAIAAIDDALETGDTRKLNRAIRSAKRKNRALAAIQAISRLTGHADLPDDTQ